MQNGQRKLHINSRQMCRLITSPLPPPRRTSTLRTSQWNATLSPELCTSSLPTYFFTKLREYGNTTTLQTTWDGLSSPSEAGVGESSSW
jgi:hypothetical protein